MPNVSPVDWSFVCNPAAHIHSQWEKFLPNWGIPEKLAPRLWKERGNRGLLSRFVVETFKLNIENLFHLNPTIRALLVSDEKVFEKKMMQVGALFFHKEVAKIIDGEQIRKIKEELGEEDFNFLRFGAARWITPPMAAFLAHTAVTGFSRARALWLGAALFLHHLSTHNGSGVRDCQTLLCLKLPPTGERPQLPEGFGMLQDKIATAYEKQANPAVAQVFTQIFNHEGRVQQ